MVQNQGSVRNRVDQVAVATNVHLFDDVGTRKFFVVTTSVCGESHLHVGGGENLQALGERVGLVGLSILRFCFRYGVCTRPYDCGSRELSAFVVPRAANRLHRANESTTKRVSVAILNSTKEKKNRNFTALV